MIHECHNNTIFKLGLKPSWIWWCCAQVAVRGIPGHTFTLVTLVDGQGFFGPTKIFMMKKLQTKPEIFNLQSETPWRHSWPLSICECLVVQNSFLGIFFKICHKLLVIRVFFVTFLISKVLIKWPGRRNALMKSSHMGCLGACRTGSTWSLEYWIMDFGFWLDGFWWVCGLMQQHQDN